MMANTTTMESAKGMNQPQFGKMARKYFTLRKLGGKSLGIVMGFSQGDLLPIHLFLIHGG